MEKTDFDRCLADLAVELRRLPLPSPVAMSNEKKPCRAVS